jgi:hypothetical protein
MAKPHDDTRDAGEKTLGAGASPGSTTDSAGAGGSDLGRPAGDIEGGIGTSASSVIGADRDDLSAGRDALEDAESGPERGGAGTSDRH